MSRYLEVDLMQPESKPEEGKQTPGPWKIGAIESGRAAVDGADGSEVTGFISPADARLIAAAPELLDVLKGLTAAGFAYVHGNGPLRPFESRLDDAHAAIAKAEGKR